MHRQRALSVSEHERPNIYRDRDRELHVQFSGSLDHRMTRQQENEVLQQVSSTFGVTAIRSEQADVTLHSGSQGQTAYNILHNPDFGGNALHRVMASAQFVQNDAAGMTSANHNSVVMRTDVDGLDVVRSSVHELGHSMGLAHPHNVPNANPVMRRMQARLIQRRGDNIMNQDWTQAQGYQATQQQQADAQLEVMHRRGAGRTRSFSV